MNGFPRISSVIEYCRLCNEKKSPVVDIFSTMVYRDGCSLAKKLNELYGIEASSPDDDLSKFICTECLRQIMRHGNLSYNLWSTLDYLMRMHAEEVMDVTSFDIPVDSLDFLLLKEKDFSIQPLVLKKQDQPSGLSFASCGMKDRGSMAGTFDTEKAGIDIEEEELPMVESCWCNECNEEFITRDELRLHSKKHDDTGTRDGFEQNEDLILSSEEYKLLSGEDRGSLDRTFILQGGGSDVEEEDELPEVEFCWCNECNEEFLSREELRLHSKKHAETGTLDSFEQNDDLILSSEEYKLLSGEVSLLKNRLCCSKCQKEFKSEKKLVRHVKKYDFQCEHRSFVNLNNQLKSLKTKRAEDSALMNTQGRDSSFHLNSKLCETTSPLTTDSLDNSNVILINNEYMSDNSGVSSLVDVRLKVRQREFGGKYSSCLGSLTSSVRFCKQDEAVLEANATEGAEIVNHETVKMEVNVSERVVICNYCTKPYSLKSKLREHIVVCHLSVESHKCSICHTYFPTESELKVHEAIHFSKSKYICSACYGNFRSRAKVSMHVKNVHNMDKSYACSACYICFPSQSELGVHQGCHSLDKKHCCSKCGKKFIDKRYYRAHVGVCQLGRLLHKCGKCGKEFLTRGDLKSHLLTHDPEKRFACHLCPMRYSQSTNLSAHIRNFHLKIKPHECGICKKWFAVRRNLRRHYTVHSDHRPFKCEYCEKYFKRKETVHSHTRQVHQHLHIKNARQSPAESNLLI